MEQFGYATVVATSQSPTGAVQGAQSCFIEQSACFVTATYFDIDGNPFTPAAVRYRLDDVCSGVNIVAWTALTPAESNQVTVQALQNSLISFTAASEDHQVLFQITDGAGNVVNARCVFSLLRVVGLA
jgi:hypothetical protein